MFQQSVKYGSINSGFNISHPVFVRQLAIGAILMMITGRQACLSSGLDTRCHQMDRAEKTNMERIGRVIRPPKHRRYEFLNTRLESFIGWPKAYVPKTPEELSAAGFFYIGSADRVTCFQCGITLRDWEEEHDPVTEHQKYSQHCSFINRMDPKDLGVEERVVESSSGKSPDTTGTVAGAPLKLDKHESELKPSCNTTALENHPVCGEHIGVQASDSEVCRGHLERLTLLDRGSSVKHGADSSTASEKASKPTLNHPNNATATYPGYKENKNLRAKMTCRLCKVTGVNTVFLPCGHLVTCSDCASRVNSCVVCSKLIVGTVKTFMA